MHYDGGVHVNQELGNYQLGIIIPATPAIVEFWKDNVLDPLFVKAGIHVGYYTQASQVEGGKDFTRCTISGRRNVVRATRLLFDGLRNHHVHSWDTFASVSSPRKTEKLELLEKMHLRGIDDNVSDDDDVDRDDDHDDGGGSNEQVMIDIDYLEDKMLLPWDEDEEGEDSDSDFDDENY